MRKIKLATGLMLCVLLLACGNSKNYFEKRLNKVTGEETFRGLHIDEPYKNVLSKEDRKYMQFPDSNILQYMYHVSDTEEYQWAYIFDDEKLREIQFDVYLGSVEHGKACTENLRKKYDKQLGASTDSAGIISWKKEGVSTDLVNESEAVGMGKVKLFIYKTPLVPVKRIVPGLE